MPPTISELLNALPDDLTPQQNTTANDALQALMAHLSQQPIPTGRFTRAWALGSMQAKIAAAYLSWWLRKGFISADKREQELNETHLKAAIELLSQMGYLRGALMKAGQMLAHWPHVVPQQFTDVLGRLHFEAPPMHFSLLREQVMNELGGDPHQLFERFETNAFAAASLGQVHRATMKDGTAVAVKIQYPNIARAIHTDFTTMRAIALPMRIVPDWDSLIRGFDDIRRMLDLEMDYENEADNLRLARSAFRESDDIVVPRVMEQFSTRRVLTMDYIDGLHLDRFLDTNPTQEQRNKHGEQIILAGLRLSYHKNLLYADPHPGNYLFLPDGRLGLLDLGCCHHYNDNDLKYVTQVEQAIGGSQEMLDDMMALAADMTPKQRGDRKRLDLLNMWCDWVWQPMVKDEVFDFGNPQYFKTGAELYGEILRKRYVRSLPINIWLTRNFFGIRAMLYHLNAKVNMYALWQQETTVKSSNEST